MTSTPSVFKPVPASVQGEPREPASLSSGSGGAPPSPSTASNGPESPPSSPSSPLPNGVLKGVSDLDLNLEEKCAICQSGIKPFPVRGDTCRPGHYFHPECLKDWRMLRKACLCPICKMEYTTTLTKDTNFEVPLDDSRSSSGLEPELPSQKVVYSRQNEQIQQARAFLVNLREDHKAEKGFGEYAAKAPKFPSSMNKWESDCKGKDNAFLDKINKYINQLDGLTDLHREGAERAYTTRTQGAVIAEQRMIEDALVASEVEAKEKAAASTLRAKEAKKDAKEAKERTAELKRKRDETRQGRAVRPRPAAARPSVSVTVSDEDD